jgi:phosphohistidine phosphatase
MKSKQQANKKLFIVRHAKSSWDHPHLSDFERPLNNRGRSDAPEMGDRLVTLGLKPDLIISSPANRAITTAREISIKLGMEPSDIRQNADLYHAHASTMRRIISQTRDEHNIIMLFGHNPGLTYLIEDLCDFDLENLPTCGVCGIEFEVESWAEVLHKDGNKFFYDFPKSKAY